MTTRFISLKLGRRQSNALKHHPCTWTLSMLRCWCWGMMLPPRVIAHSHQNGWIYVGTLSESLIIIRSLTFSNLLCRVIYSHGSHKSSLWIVLESYCNKDIIGVWKSLKGICKWCSRIGLQRISLTRKTLGMDTGTTEQLRLSKIGSKNQCKKPMKNWQNLIKKHCWKENQQLKFELWLIIKKFLI